MTNHNHRYTGLCVCGHFDRHHKDIGGGACLPSGLELGEWGAGECTLCGCTQFECVGCYEERVAKARANKPLEADDGTLDDIDPDEHWGDSD